MRHTAGPDEGAKQELDFFTGPTGTECVSFKRFMAFSWCCFFPEHYLPLSTNDYRYYHTRYLLPNNRTLTRNETNLGMWYSILVYKLPFSHRKKFENLPYTLLLQGLCWKEVYEASITDPADYSRLQNFLTEKISSTFNAIVRSTVVSTSSSINGMTIGCDYARHLMLLQ